MSEPQTPLQKRYYWAVLCLIAQTWLPHIERKTVSKFLHDEFRSNILGMEEVVGAGGVVSWAPISTTTLDRDEFSDYVEAVIVAAIEGGVSFPDSPYGILEVAPRLYGEPLPFPAQARRSGAPKAAVAP